MFVLFVIVRKFNISMLVFGLTYKMASKQIKIQEGLFRFSLQFIGAFTAIVSLAEISITTSNFIEPFTVINPETGHYHLGTTLGAVKPIMRG
jgi:hypothetical protein